MKKLLLIISIFTLVFTLSAQENFKHGLGFTGGMISGSGFSYRQMNETYGFQIALGVITLGDDDDIDFEESGGHYGWSDTTSTHIMEDEGISYLTNIGVSYYKHLHRGEKSTFYCLAGTAAYMDFGEIREQIFVYNTDDGIWETSGEPTEETEFNLRFNVGIGIGIDYKLTENISLNLDWPLVFSKSDEELDIIMYIPQAGIHYYFK